MEGLCLEELCISDVAVISGVRALGREIDYRIGGRKKNGLFYVFCGQADFCDENGSHITICDGGLLFLPKNNRYKMQYLAKATTFVVVNFDMTNAAGEEIALFSEITPLAQNDPLRRIAGIMAKLELCGSAHGFVAMCRKKELLYRLLGQVGAASVFESRMQDIPPQILAGVRLLEQTYLENLPIARFAEESNVSVNTFRNLFGKQFGISPIKYRNHLRIERARQLLAEGGFSIAEVAFASGFENLGYFCRTYRRLIGENPRDTKRRCEGRSS